MFIRPIIESGSKVKDGEVYYDHVWLSMNENDAIGYTTMFCDALSDLFGKEVHDAVCREGQTIEVETSIHYKV